MRRKRKRPIRQPIRIRESAVLLVEGRDEQNLFTALLKSESPAPVNIQIVVAGGTARFRPNLLTIRRNMVRSPIAALGIVRDANGNAARAFQSVCDAVKAAGLEPPTGHASFSTAFPSIGVFVVPDGLAPGAVETLCRRSVEGTHAARCVEQLLLCLGEEASVPSPVNADKTFAHAYLAAGANPVARVGEGALQGAWDFGSPAFAGLKRFLRELAVRGSQGA